MPQFLETHHIINGLYPKADAFATSATTDYVSLKDYGKAVFIIHTGDATAGTADGVITVLAATAADGTGATAIPFRYSRSASSTTVDSWIAMTEVAATGVAMVAADNYLYVVEVTAEEVASGLADADFCACKVTEATNDPIVAGMLTILCDPRYPQSIPVSAIA